MFLSVTFATALRQNIKGPPKLCNHFLFLNGSGTRLRWTSSRVFPDHRRVMLLSHFLPVKETISASQLADLYVSRIVSLHGIPLEISSDRGSIFTSRFWD